MESRKIQIILLTACLLGLFTWPVWGQSPVTPKEIVVAIDSEYAPYEFVDNSGRATGFTVDLMKEIGRRSGVRIRIQPMPWPDAVAGLENGSVDIINMINTPERAAKYAFSEPHSQISQAIFRADTSGDDNIVDLDSLAGHTVALQENDISLEKLAGRTDFETVIVRSKEEGFLLLNARKVDAFFAAEQAGISMIQQYKLENVEIAAVGLFPQPFSFAARKDNVALIDFLNPYLQEIKQSGEYDALVNKWFLPLPAKEDWFTHYRPQLLLGIGLLALIAGIFAVWSVSLRAMVERRTQALKESQAQVALQASALNAAGNGIVITNIDGNIIWANTAFCNNNGFELSEVLGQNPRLLKSGVHPESFYQDLWDTILAGNVWHGDITNRRKDDTLYTDATTITPVLDENRNITHFIAIKQDISERVEMERTLKETNQQLMETLAELRNTQDMLVRQERLAAVGQLSAGIAHDFNNILTSIMGFTELIQMSSDTPPSVQKRLKNVSSAGERAAKLVRQILDFSRKTVRQTKEFDVAPFVENLLHFMESTLPETVQIEFDATPGDYAVQADPDQMQQVLTNLVLNARDAMPNGGSIKITLERGSGCECAICQTPLHGEWVRISIADDGMGMSPDILPRIFEPFFTTKDVGQGTGLGLSQVAGIIEENQGHVSVKSSVGQGTTFVLSLPPSGMAEPSDTEETTGVTRGNGELILVVEDEPNVLSVTAEMIRALGYRVLEAKNGFDALKLYNEHAAEISLVLSDMVMPDMDGALLFERLKTKNPAIRMVIMSGYPLAVQNTELMERGLVDWIKKPITFGQLSQLLSGTLPTSQASRWDKLSEINL